MGSQMGFQVCISMYLYVNLTLCGLSLILNVTLPFGWGVVGST